MATMIPEDIKQFTTDGEGLVYNFLATVAKPDVDYTVWYSPDIRGREPDFILYNNVVGLIIFEVKDWSLDQIVEADRKQFHLFINGREERRKNPMQQVREYFFACMDALKKDGRLMSVDHGQQGNPRVPINCGLILPNINKMEFRESGLESVLDGEKIFFWDDLHPESPLAQDGTGNTFQKVLLDKFEPRFPCQLTGKEKVHLKQVIFPVVRVEQPRRQKEAEFSSLESWSSSLDHHQEAIARKHDGGHRILKGPSGCGKTLVLIHKIIFLLRYNPNIKSILFVCFNITLVRYIKRILSEKMVSVGDRECVDVVHFFELCNRITGEKIDFEGQDKDYYQIVLDDAIEVSKTHKKYDAILIDEGQDFSDDMYRVILNLLNPKTDALTIALDENQNIYSKTRSWKELGVHARGRTHTLNYVYRSTKELTEFATRFSIGGDFLENSGKPQQRELFPGYFEYHGPPPFISKHLALSELLHFIVGEIDILVSEKQYSLSEIAILYTKSAIPGEDVGSLPEMIGEALEHQGFLYEWISEDYRAKRSYDITTDSITLSTVHSVKGFDYAAVFAAGLDFYDYSRWSEDQINNITYVAVTRARFRLYIPYLKENQVISKLKSCVL